MLRKRGFVFCFSLFILCVCVCVYLCFDCAWADTTICVKRSQDDFMSHPCGSRDRVQDIQAFMREAG